MLIKDFVITIQTSQYILGSSCIHQGHCDCLSLLSGSAFATLVFRVTNIDLCGLP